MDRESSRHVTVDEDADAFMAKQIYLDRHGKIWHDLDFVYESLAAKGLKRPKAQWRNDAKRYWQRSGVSEREFVLRSSDDSTVGLIWNVCSTFALYVLVWSCIHYGKDAAFQTACSVYLVVGCLRTRELLFFRSCDDAELHLQRTISETFEHPTNLDFIGIPMGVSILAGKVFYLSVNVLANRCWSFAVRHHGAPDIYAGLFSASRDKRSWAKARMEEHWKRLLVLEQRRFSLSTAMQLWSDLLATRNNAVRMMYCAFERDKFKEDSSQGCKLLRALLETLPDNKIVEDGHGSVQLRGAFCDFCNFRTHSVVANRASGRYWQPNVKYRNCHCE